MQEQHEQNNPADGDENNHSMIVQNSWWKFDLLTAECKIIHDYPLMSAIELGILWQDS